VELAPASEQFLCCIKRVFPLALKQSSLRSAIGYRLFPFLGVLFLPFHPAVVRPGEMVDSGFPGCVITSFFAFFVTPVKTGVQNSLSYHCSWIPAFAGMTI
jgi:hypothetical protein